MLQVLDEQNRQAGDKEATLTWDAEESVTTVKARQMERGDVVGAGGLDATGGRGRRVQGGR